MRQRAAAKIIACSIFLLAAAACQPALADCIAGSVYFGNVGALTFVRIDLNDPAASWQTYMLQDPTINQGTVPVGMVAFDLGIVGGEPGTAVVFGDWAGGMGMNGCPLGLDSNYSGHLDDDQANEVFVFSDAKNGSTILILASTANVFDFDSASGTGSELPRSVMKPQIISASISSTIVNLELVWDAPVINQDTRSIILGSTLLRGYRVFEELRSASGALLSSGEVPDTDGSTTDTHALVALLRGTAGDTWTLTVGADLAGGTGVGATARGVPSPPIMNPGLAIPKEPRGRGKGLLTAPGQQK